MNCIVLSARPRGVAVLYAVKISAVEALEAHGAVILEYGTGGIQLEDA